MTARDIMPFKAPLGGHMVTDSAPLDAAESFREGELITVNTTGAVEELPTDGTPALVADLQDGRVGGVALSDGDTTRTDILFPPVTGDVISYVPFDDGTLFITNRYTDATGTEIVKNGNLRGNALQIESNGGRWGPTSTAATVGTDVAFVVVDVLDALKQPVAESTALATAGAGWLVGRIVTR